MILCILKAKTNYIDCKFGSRKNKNQRGTMLNFWAQKKASYLHRTATTIYPCCVPTLGDSTGAGRVGLASCKYTIF